MRGAHLRRRVHERHLLVWALLQLINEIRLRDDDELRASLDRRITGTAAFLADNYAGEVTSIISETIERWDADEASDKIELMVGKDLQYIRLNGTVVGALAGLAIYTVSYLFFGV